MRKMAIVGILVAAAWLSCCPVHSATGNASEQTEINQALLNEVQALRNEIKLLRTEISSLRAELAEIKRAGVPAVTGTAAPGPKVSFSQVPGRGGGPDSRGDIAGVVTGLAKPQEHKIVIYALTDRWYVQPLVADPYTAISSEGAWSNWTHLGTTYAALVVRPSYQPKPETMSLPPVGGDVIAVGQIPAKQ